MFSIKNILINAFVFALAFEICFLRVNAADCDDDEECKSIFDCEEEYKYFLNRQFKKLKICGVAVKTSEVCCKKSIAPSTALKNLCDPDEGCFSNHPNVNLINHKKCGKATQVRIIDGTRALIGQYPWMTLLRYRSLVEDENSFSFKCGGSLITKKHVLTAAHCIKVSGFKLYSVRVGEHTISTALDCDSEDDPHSCNRDKPPIQDIRVAKAISHESYDTRQKINDIGLISLIKDVIFEKIRNVRTICLPVLPKQQIDNIKPDEKLTKPKMAITGWGQTENSRNISDVLMQGFVPYLPNDQCEAQFAALRKKHNYIRIKIIDGHLCAGGFNNTDHCRGDSGGPIIYPAETSSDIYRMFQHGIISAGIGCSSHDVYPGLYTRVSKYMTWILDNLSV